MAKPGKKRPARPNATGRTNKTSRFTMLPHLVLTSNAYRACSPTARALLVELAMLENGDNNGSLYMSVRTAAERIGVVDLTAAGNAFDELQERRLIAMTKGSHFRVKASDQSRARCWRLTWKPCGRRTASDDYLKAEAEPLPGTKERKRMESGAKALKVYRKARDAEKLPVLDSDTMTGLQANDPPVPVLDSNTSNGTNGGNSPNPVVLDSTTYPYATRGRSGVLMPGLGWWAPNWSHVGAWTAYAAVMASQRAMGTSKRRMTPSKNRATPQKSANLKNLAIPAAPPAMAAGGIA